MCYAVRCRLSIKDKVALIKTFAPEITTEAELEALLTNKPNPVAYDGFEPSGRMHIAQVRPPCRLMSIERNASQHDVHKLSLYICSREKNYKCTQDT